VSLKIKSESMRTASGIARGTDDMDKGFEIERAVISQHLALSPGI
jgi:hypothetical protein